MAMNTPRLIRSLRKIIKSGGTISLSKMEGEHQDSVIAKMRKFEAWMNAWKCLSLLMMLRQFQRHRLIFLSVSQSERLVMGATTEGELRSSVGGGELWGKAAVIAGSEAESSEAFCAKVNFNSLFTLPYN